jgi:hypothetical protein
MRISPMCTCHMPCLLIFLDLFILILLGEECKSWTSSLHNCLQVAITSFPLGHNILLSNLYLEQPHSVFFTQYGRTGVIYTAINT